MMPSSCVMAKAKVALGVKNNYTGNSKSFSKNEWEKALRILAKRHPIADELLIAAISDYNYYRIHRENLRPARI
jgi:hypothetical protein